MSSSFSWASLVQTCLVLVVVICILIPDDVRGSPIGVTRRAKGRSGRRDPSLRYRVGYMFGKRSEAVDSSTKLFDVISRRLISLPELTNMLMEDPAILQQILSHLDKDNDGYITMVDLL